MVLQQGAQLRLEFTGHRRAGAQQFGKRRAFLQRIVQVQPPRTGQVGPLAKGSGAQTALGHQSVAGLWRQTAASECLGIQCRQQADFAQQQQFKTA